MTGAGVDSLLEALWPTIAAAQPTDEVVFDDEDELGPDLLTPARLRRDT